MIVLQQETPSWGKTLSEKTLEELLPFSMVVIDKPCGPSSHEVASFVKKILGVSKTGHSGTLDPEVSGVLPVLLGEATKAAGYLLKDRKRYVGIMKLRVPKTAQQIETAFARFRGKIYQKPPLKSAVRRELRIREVFSLDLLEVDGPFSLFECEVEAGTYIRKLCSDVGDVLECGGLMAELRRTVSSGFDESRCVSLQKLSDALWLWKEKNDPEPLRHLLIPVEQAVFLKKVVASDGALKAITTGADLAIPGILELDETIRTGDPIQIVTGKGELMCFAKSLMDSDEIRGREKGIAFDIARVIRSHGIYFK